MKKLTFATLFALMGLCCSSASAGIMLDFVANPDPAPGVKSVTVRLSGTDGANVSTISGFTLTGAHQIWDNPAGNGTSPEVGDLEGTFGNPAWTPLDTHMLAIPGYNNTPNWVPVETNDGTNPAGVDLAPGNPAFAAFAGTAGIGSLTFTDSSNPANNLASGVAFLAPQPATVDFLQVVAPEGSPAILNMRVEDSTATGYSYVDIPVVVGGGLEGMPEAGDISGLLQGAFADRNFGPVLYEVMLSGDDVASFEANGVGVIDKGDGKYDLLVGPADGDFSGFAPGTILSGDVKFVGATSGEVNYSFSISVPEPSTVALSALALVGLVGFARRRG